MKMTTIRNIILAFVVLAGVSSCKKVLNPAPAYTLDGTQRFKTISDFDYALTGAYALFRSGNYFGSSSNAFVGLTDYISDNLTETQESLANYEELVTWTYAKDESNISATWQSVYRVIGEVNLLLSNNIDNFAGSDPGAVRRIKGQALAIRALAHFDALRYWVDDYDRNSTKPGVPYITQFNYNALPARGTVKDDYTAIEADLKQALSLLSSGLDHSVNNSVSRSYIDKTGVN